MYLPRPMKATDQSEHFKLTGEIALPDGWEERFVVEPKIDGVRAFLVSNDGQPSLWLASSMRKVKHEILGIEIAVDRYQNIALDGELVIPGEPLGTIVGALNSSRDPRSLLRKAKFYAFDILSLGDGLSFEDQPLSVRRSALETVAFTHDNEWKDCSFGTAWVEVVPQFQPEPFIYDAIRKSGFEGFMLKDRDSRYEQKRSKAWQKVKWLSSVDCFVIGSERGNGSNSQLVGALIMGVYNENGDVVEIGKHGVFPHALRKEMSAEGGALNPAWYGTVMEVTFQSTGTNLRMRHPRLLRLRPDKLKMDCTVEQFEQGKHALNA